MATVTIERPAEPVGPSIIYPNQTAGVRSWLLTRDHKRIAILRTSSWYRGWPSGGRASRPGR